MEPEEERQLVRRVAAGSEAAFEELVREHQGRVERLVARMLPDERDREEVCQDVFLKVYRHIGDFRGESRLSTWIGSIAYRTCLNRLQGRERPVPGSQIGAPASDARRAPFPEGFAHGGPSPAEDAERAELRAFLEEALASLRPDYRAVVSFYHLEGMPVAEVAEATGLPEGTVKSHLYRARREMKERLLETLDPEAWRTG